MKKAYLAISYSNRKLFDTEINSLKQLFTDYNIELLVFVDKYHFKPNQELEMMQTAFAEIDSSDMLIAELTTKSIGVGIEIGYAYAQQKDIYYLRKKNAEYSTTAAGCANYNLEYVNDVDLVNQLKKVITRKI